MLLNLADTPYIQASRWFWWTVWPMLLRASTMLRSVASARSACAPAPPWLSASSQSWWSTATSASSRLSTTTGEARSLLTWPAESTRSEWSCPGSTSESGTTKSGPTTFFPPGSSGKIFHAYLVLWISGFFIDFSTTSWKFKSTNNQTSLNTFTLLQLIIFHKRRSVLFTKYHWSVASLLKSWKLVVMLRDVYQSIVHLYAKQL